MKDTLAISFRPKTLDNLIGCDKIIKRIRARAASGRLPKAWMFSGQTGSGKTTIARIIATALQCHHKVLFGSCLKCYHNQKTFDIIELNMPDVQVAQLREILEGAAYNPKPGSRRRVYILDEAHRMSASAQNVLLKYTEDCPRTTVWITCTTEPHMILRTLRRRHKIYALPPLELSDVRKLVKIGLKKIHSELDADDLTEKLLEKQITSPALIMNAIENYAEGADIEEATDVEGISNIDTKGLCVALTKGNWDDSSKILYQAKQDDVIPIKASVGGYLRGILLGEKNGSPRAKMAADSILKLYEVRDDLSATSAVLYKVCKYFSKYGE
jgi:replication-associated recombination protein RarA